MALDSFPSGFFDFAPVPDNRRINDEAFQLMLEASSLRAKDGTQVKTEAKESPEEKAERQLLQSIATLIDGKGDNTAAIALLLAQIPENPISRPLSGPINEKLKALGSDKSVSFVVGEGGRTMKVYREEKTQPEKGDKSSSKFYPLYDVKAPIKKTLQ
ncbi:MAG: hypothetical protein K2X93_06330 [Candidatus Obscuribacterales bacterium]|nr:hypothetical protein [Candidatus Obscuribacterales bacterium]